jgi:hypothetical protein
MRDGVDREMGALAGGEGHGEADIEREDPLAEIVGFA